MRFRQLASKTKRAYIGFDGWGIGITIIESKSGATASLDFGIDNDMKTLAVKKCNSIPEANLWAVRKARELADEIRKWAEE